MIKVYQTKKQIYLLVLFIYSTTYTHTEINYSFLHQSKGITLTTLFYNNLSSSWIKLQYRIIYKQCARKPYKSQKIVTPGFLTRCRYGRVMSMRNFLGEVLKMQNLQDKVKSWYMEFQDRKLVDISSTMWTIVVAILCILLSFVITAKIYH